MTSPIIQDLIITPSHKYIAMKWHDVLKESLSPDSFKENYLSALCVWFVVVKFFLTNSQQCERHLSNPGI
jgi:hypothetical protein